MAVPQAKPVYLSINPDLLSPALSQWTHAAKMLDNVVSMRPILIFLAILLTVVPAWAQPGRDDVQHAIDRMQQYLLQKQDEHGSWEGQFNSPQHIGGETALVCLALLTSGQAAQSPSIAKAIAFLEGVSSDGTYAVSLRAHLWAHMPPIYQPSLEQEAQWLLGAHDGMSRFNYGSTVYGRFDHSVTQYGLLGLWEADKRGVEIPDEIWNDATTYFVDAQNGDGGWGYMPGNGSSGSMTAAGITVLSIAMQQTQRQQVLAPEKASQAIDRGLAWLDTHFTPEANPNGGHTFYYLYGIERAGLATGMRFFNGHDWYRDGAAFILGKQRDDGSIEGSCIETAFALMFLSRGAHPVWANKLALPLQNWNNRPGDLYFLTQHISRLREADMNWQTVRVTDPVEAWLDAPVLYLASDQSAELTDAGKAAIKRYLDLGGMLWINPDNGSGALSASILRMARQWYPDYSVRTLEPEHPIYQSLYRIAPERQIRIDAVSNGVRELILLPERDMGYRLQSDEIGTANNTWQHAVNIWALATDRGVMDNTLEPTYIARQPRTPEQVRRVVIGRARFAGSDVPEPNAWELMGNLLYNRAGIDLVVEDVALKKIDECDFPLVHLSGVAPTKLTPEQVRAVTRYVQRGGVVLVECVGGRQSFAWQVEAQLGPAFGGAAIPLSSHHPIISGEGLEHGFDATRTPYRRFAVMNMHLPPRPRLAVLMHNDQPGVVISNEDITLGMMGVRYGGIVGYNTDSARRLAGNLVMWIAAQNN